jgi:hypothetical protein
LGHWASALRLRTSVTGTPVVPGARMSLFIPVRRPEQGRYVGLTGPESDLVALHTVLRRDFGDSRQRLPAAWDRTYDPAGPALRSIASTISLAKDWR